LLKKYLIYGQNEDFNINNIELRFEIRRKIIAKEESSGFETLTELENSRGEISKIFVEVMLSVCLYYENIRD
jgi:hypothetical protein